MTRHFVLMYCSLLTQFITRLEMSQYLYCWSSNEISVLEGRKSQKSSDKLAVEIVILYSNTQPEGAVYTS